MTDNQLKSMTTKQLLQAFLNKACNNQSEHVADRMLSKLKDRLNEIDFKNISIEYYDSKSLIGNKRTLAEVVKEVQTKYN